MCLSADSAGSLPAPPSAVSLADALAGLRERYLAAADATAAFSAVYVLPALCLLVCDVAASVARCSMLTASSGGEAVFWAVWSGLAVAVFAALLCLHGQQLETAAGQPALLLLRRPPRSSEAAAEAARLVALVQGLRPAAAVGDVSLSGRLLGTVAVGFVTYLVVLLQMH